MTIVRCPRCRDEVSVPARATGRALVRCPLCLEEYLLAEALASAPPPLVIIGGEVPEEIREQPAGGMEYRLAAGPAGLFDGDAPAAPTVARPAMIRAPRRSRPAPKSGVLLLINYVAGGVLGLLLGLLVLWHVFRRDPLELGPQVAQYVPWVVPQKFRGQTSPPPGPAQAAPSGRSAASQPATALDAGPALPTARPSKSRATSPRGSKAAPPEDALSELQTLPELTPPPPREPDLLPSVEVPKLDETVVPAPRRELVEPPQPPPARSEDITRSKPGAERESAAASRGPMPDLTDLLTNWTPAEEKTAARSNAPQLAQQFMRAVQSAQEALSQPEPAPGEESAARERLLADFCRAAGEAGAALAQLELSDEQLTESIERLETMLLSLGPRRAAVQAAVLQRWPELTNGQGGLLIGKVERFLAAGEVHEVVLDAGAPGNPLRVHVVTRHNPRNLCEIGDELVAVGRVVDNPKQELAGYEGEHPRVLLMGFGVRLH